MVLLRHRAFISRIDGFLFYKEIKSDQPIDLFTNVVVSGVSIGSAVITYIIDGFDITRLAHILYLIVIAIAIVFTIYYVIKYFKQKKAQE